MRTVLAMMRENTKPMTMTRVSVLGPTATTKRKATITVGRARAASTILPTTMSTTPAEVALGEADRRADRRAQQGGEGSDLEDVAGADDHPRQHVLADRSSVPNQWAAEGARFWLKMSGCRGIEGSEQVPEDRADDPPEKDQRADDEGLGAEELAELLAADTSHRDVECARGADGGGEERFDRYGLAKLRRGLAAVVLAGDPE